jgi:alpha-galactosidase/6-phospho-beta-glucosidase family protein
VTRISSIGAWSAICTLPQIHEMVGEILEAQAKWLPQFKTS